MPQITKKEGHITMFETFICDQTSRSATILCDWIG